MKKQLFIYTTLIIFTGLLLLFAASVYADYTNSLSFAKDTLTDTTKIFAALYENNADISVFMNTHSEMRVTIISSDGTVLADSRPLDIDGLENHLNRPEIQAASNNSPKAYVRYSDSLGIDLIYYALKAENNGEYVFIRSAVAVAKIEAYLFRSLPLLIILLVIISLLCFLFAKTMAHRLVAPFDSVEQKLLLLSKGEYKPEPVAGSYEEVDKIVREIDDIATILQKNLTDLRSEKNKLDYIINNIGDGLLAVDESKSITLINFAALNIFHAEPDIIGKNLNYLYYDKIFCGAVEECISLSRDALFEFAFEGSIYIITVKRLPDADLVMVILSNVTENRKNAIQRGEFFANASHELKTPLTAVKGFNELAAIHNKDEDIQKYIDGINRETDRMLYLIGDMLKLSELENTPTVNPADISLSQVVSDAIEGLSTTIATKSLIVETSGSGTVISEQGHIYELVKNLIENAVKYTNQGGRVSVTIENIKGGMQLIVSDNGIGIPPEEQTRIFERFYRVEKSRSQRNGGTGLGLSIVKHICVLYDWKLSLKSKLGVGTEVTVTFSH